MELKTFSVPQLLLFHAELLEELRSRGVLRTANNPTGDLAEYLFCKAFGWTQAANSEKSYDALDADGLRYQIKGRRLHPRNASRQLSAIRDLDGFDMLAAVLFDEHYGIARAVLIPAAIVRERSTFVPHTNSHKFLLQESICILPKVIDITARLSSDGLAFADAGNT